MDIYTNFIKENIAVENATKITVLDRLGKSVGVIPLGNLTTPDVGGKLYSFGVISDVHIGVSTSDSDLTRALNFFNDIGTLFVCCCGDLANNGTVEQLTTYKGLINEKVHSITGNHDWYGVPQGVENPITLENYQSIIGKPLYYSFTQGNDVFIMFGMSSCNTYDTNGGIFTTEQLQWLYETLEANRNKRCFLFQHIFPSNSNKSCGNAYNLYGTEPMWGGTDGIVFENLMKHYHNVILFHGHSHIVYELQTKTEEYPANYDKYFGCHSIHLPSITQPRVMNDDGTSSKNSAGSQGCVVGVYENHIIVKGRDFEKGEFLPIATYCLNTSLQTIEAKTFTDSTGTITV